MAVDLREDQKIAAGQLKAGSILCGGTGSGKSRTALAYYFEKVCKGQIDSNGKKFQRMKEPKDLYIITTARKRDTREWEEECALFLISPDEKLNKPKMKLTVDSWNNIHKYTNVCNAFFIFDEQRVVGSGAWVKAFLAITKKNQWILLSATPGDTWTDYIPVFIANGFYKNRSEFLKRHVVFARYSKFPKIDRYLEVNRLIKLRNSILINMHYIRKTVSHKTKVLVDYDKTAYRTVHNNRWNPFEDKPIKNVSEFCYLSRKVVNSDPSRAAAIKELISEHPKVIIFYNFDYELEILRQMAKELDIYSAEWNGHKHQPVPEGNEWVYIVQYSAASEAWNCITTNAIIFYSQNYSYKVMKQSEGRIDRANTPYPDLYYYSLVSEAPIDIAIERCLAQKKKFNESSYIAF